MSDYLDGELAPHAPARMERHLGECDECRRLLAGLRRTLDGLNRLSEPRPAAWTRCRSPRSVRARLSELD